MGQKKTHQLKFIMILVFSIFPTTSSLFSFSSNTIRIANAQSSNNILDSGWNSLEAYLATDTAWGDFDNDGDLDLAVGNDRSPTKIYRNCTIRSTDDGCVANELLSRSAIWSADIVGETRSIEWGDVDNDGDIDLVVGNASQSINIYRNCIIKTSNDGCDNKQMFSLDPWLVPGIVLLRDISLGDADNDGDLDLAVGILNQQSRLYSNCTVHTLNDGCDTATAIFTDQPVWQSKEINYARSIAWGDVDSDGDIDLTTGNINQPTRLYRNCTNQTLNDGCDGSAVILTNNAVWSSNEAINLRTIAWGDVDRDKDIDLITGGIDEPLRLYRNNNGILTGNADWSSVQNDDTISVSWGDYDGDGDLDLATGNLEDPLRLYRNTNGILSVNPVWSSNTADNTWIVTWGDVDNDGDIDLAIANNGQPSQVYLNNSGTIPLKPRDPFETMGIAWGDYNLDAKPDLAVANYDGKVQVYQGSGDTLSSQPSWSTIDTDVNWSVAWGDFDNDSYPDLAVGGYKGISRIYHNDHGVLSQQPIWQTSHPADVSVLSVL